MVRVVGVEAIEGFELGDRRIPNLSVGSRSGYYQVRSFVGKVCEDVRLLWPCHDAYKTLTVVSLRVFPSSRDPKPRGQAA